VSALSIIGFIGLGILKVAGMLAIIMGVIAMLAYGSHYLVMPVVRHTPDRVKAAWTLFWRAVTTIVMISFSLFLLFAIGQG